ncbi:hypothetical protein PACTADRAFT_47595 [Pachysolen tannophilus NRRL Y-2460]|uniref:Obg-like ATPase homolog n=1 Tax=Pachysolen tannophilus NRRL Y-2460 TaxID=669874 RepID=A0A1E4U1F5_PACTA|nr:hypothetical protein PACTADRAFT_47595 [Pachysolen tannophilus NRRL Y-2460]
MANVGKSTFFQAITKSELGNPANYPFATITPEEARVIVPSDKLDHLYQLFQSENKIPANLKIFDIAGLVRGASNGSGLGNQFLNDIRQVDGIFQVVRAFIDDEITHVEGKVDPVRDLTVIIDELLLKDMEFVENSLEKLQKELKNKNRKQPGDLMNLELEIKTLEKCYEWLMEGKRIANYENWSNEEIEILNTHNLLTAKPCVYLINCNEKDYASKTNQFIPEIKQWISENSPNSPFIIFSAAFETQFNKLSSDKKELSQYLNALNVEESALPKIISAMRDSLNLISFYTCGDVEARQWTIRKGIKAIDAAGVIHSDLQNTFINAQIMKFCDLINLSAPFDEKLIKSQGKQLKVGKNYIIEDGDVVFFNAAAAKSKKVKR